MKENEKEPVDLPENAFRELEEGEEYNPIMSPGREYREVTPWSVSWGIVMAVLFSAASLSSRRCVPCRSPISVRLRRIRGWCP